MEGPSAWIEDRFSFSKLQHWQANHTTSDILELASSVWTAWIIEHQLGLASFYGEIGMSEGKSLICLWSGQM